MNSFRYRITHHPHGFSLFEALATIAVVGILTWAVIASQTSIHRTAFLTKLESDVLTVNQAIRIYIANGGSLRGISEPQAVLDKMKTVLSTEDDAKQVGFGGAMIDRRLAVRATTAEEVESAAKRAVWSDSRLRFDVTTAGAGVAEFYLDDSKGTENYGTESRQPDTALTYETGNGWIWHYTDGQVPERTAPTIVSTSPSTPPGNPGNPTPLPTPSRIQLQPPVLSIPSGSYPLSRFDLSLSIADPNTSHSSWIMYSVNGTSYARYSTPLNISRDCKVVAFATGDPYLFYSSGAVEALYAAKPPVTLSPPAIITSHTQFLWETAETVLVTLENPNDPTLSSLEYQVADGGWTPYSAPFPLPIQNHQAGVIITAHAKPLSVDYLLSSESSANVLGPPIATKLQAPVITTSEPNFQALSVESISVNLTDWNPRGSELEYRLPNGAWQPYTGAFNVSWANYSTGLDVEARARSTSPSYTTSDTALKPIGLTPVQLQIPTIALSQPNFIPDSIDIVSVTLSNPNPASSGSVLEYRIKNEDWQSYSSTFDVKRANYATGLTLEARATSTSQAYTNSPSAQGSIGLTPAQLLSPQIALSNSKFDENTSTITVTLTNPNPAGRSTLYYAIKKAAESYPPLNSFVAYSGPIQSTVAAYPDGFQVQTFAKSLDTVNYLDSNPVEGVTTADFFGVGLQGDILFVLDASSSMTAPFGSTTRLGRMKQEAINAISSLKDTQKFSVIVFSAGVVWSDGSNTLKPANTSNKAAAIAGLLSVHSQVGTNYEVGLRYALNLSKKPSQIIFLSDGLPNQRNYLDELDSLVRLKVKINTVGIGSDEGQIALREMANRSGGIFTYVSTPQVSGALKMSATSPASVSSINYNDASNSNL